MHLTPRIAVAVAALLLLAARADARAPRRASADDEPLRYTLRFPAPATHYFEVEADVPTSGRDAVELMMAVWTPGSYLVRDFSRHVENVRADGAVSRAAKNRWRVETGGAARITVRYRVYAREMTVRTSWVDADFAMLNGAPTFLTLADRLGAPHEVHIERPEAWTTVETALPAIGPDRFLAPDFDTLVDSPIVIGNPAGYDFEVRGVPHRLVNVDEGGIWDGARARDDVERLVETQAEFWGQVPYDRYLFLNVIAEAGGGLEHKASTLMITSRWNQRVGDRYLRWLELVSHELFHTWNVKRLRPAALGPFDYERENYTESLWIAEGATSYYDGLLVHRAGLSTRKQYLEGLSKMIDSVQRTPGREVRSLSLASYDAWIRHYRHDENSVNSDISYYSKGAVVSWLLDAHIRGVTDGKRSLDDVMRAAYDRFAGPRGYTPTQFRAVVAEIAGASLDDFFRDAVDGTVELDYSAALAWFGLRFAPPDADAKSTEPKDPPPGWLGLETKSEHGRLVVRQARRGTPAHAAGLNVGDEIIAIDDYRVRADGLDEREKQYRPGDEATLLIARREALRRMKVKFAEKPRDAWKLEVLPAATPAHKARLDAWLGAEKRADESGKSEKGG